MDKIRFSCPCHFGLESVLKYEVGKIGGEDIAVSDGRVAFSGDENILARANIRLSTAERVLILLSEFEAFSFEDLFQGIKKIPWEKYISKNDAFPVKGHSLNSKLHSVPDCQSIIKKAVVTHLGEKYGVRYFTETNAVHQIQFGILKDKVSVYLDTSGQGLHKRGYRKNANAAPIKETLAAGIIDLARVRPDTCFTDPFCGSGTFLIEAAYKATNTAPGLRRTFSAEKWDCFSPDIWREERRAALEDIRKDCTFRAFGSDIDPECVSLTLANCAKAGAGDYVKAEVRDISDFRRTENGILICNPPYGERLLEIREAEELYKKMGQVFAPDKDHPCYIISPHEDFEHFFGKKADKKRKLYNGMIKCDLYMYFR